MIAAGTVVVASIALVGCSAPEDTDSTKSPWELSTSTPEAKGPLDEVHWGIQPEPRTIDAAKSFTYTSNQILANVCDSLMRQNADYSVTPALAESVDQVDDLTLVYTLRPGVLFHDGTTMTADDVVASLSRNLDPASASVWTNIYSDVKSITATGELEVTVKFSSPDNSFNLSMSTAAGVVESAATLAAAGADYGTPAAGVNCTGAYALTEWDAGTKIVLDRFDGYWDKDLVPLTKRFVFDSFAEKSTLVSAAQSGQIDGAWLLPSTSFTQLQAAGNLYLAPDTSVQSLVVANLEGPLGDARVRQALLMAIDRQGIVDSAQLGAGTVVDSTVPELVWDSPLVEGYSPDRLTHYAQDIDAAKKLVEDAGATGQSITIGTVNFDPSWGIIAKETAAAAERIGLKATINTMQPADFFALFSDPEARKKVDLFQTRWGAPNGDPSGMLDVLGGGSTANYGGWSNSDYDAALAEALASDNNKERTEHLADAEVIFNAELPWLPLYSPLVSLWMEGKVTGATPSAYFQWYPWAAQIGASE